MHVAVSIDEQQNRAHRQEKGLILIQDVQDPWLLWKIFIKMISPLPRTIPPK